MMKSRWLGLVIFLILAITVVHMTVPAGKLELHSYLRELYLIPIILAGLWWGARGGLTAAIISSVLYLPHFLFKSSPQFHTRNIVEILLFILVGYLVGRYRDTSKQDHMARNNKATLDPAAGQHFLFCVDSTPSSIVTARWFAKLFSKDLQNSVTLIWVTPVMPHNIPGALTDKVESSAGKENKAVKNLRQIKEILLAADAKKEKIHVKIVECGIGQSISERILEELKSGPYDTMLVSKHEATKTKELFFGDTTLSLIRKSPVPILVAKGLDG